MNTFKTYSACNVNVTFLGHVFEGLGEGDDAITVTMNEDVAQLTIGMQGDGVASMSCNASGEVTIRLLHGSATNEFLSKKVAGYRGGSLVTGELIITEVGSNSKVVAQKTFIAKAPDFSRGATAGEVEWRFVSPAIDIFHGGSEEVGA
jgi:hypothetical protein